MTTDTTQLNDALAANYILIELEVRSWGVNRTDRVASAEYTATKGTAPDAAKVMKNLMTTAGKELNDVKTRGQSLRHFVYEHTLPWSSATAGAKRGPRLLATSLSMNFMHEFEGLKKEYDDAVSILAAVWDTRVAEGMRALGPLADATDYPTSAEVAALFTVGMDMQAVPAISDLSRVNVPAPIAEALASQHIGRSQAQLDNAMADLRERVCDELARINKQLSKSASGEKTRLYDSLITNMQGLVQLARSMNVGNNPMLDELAEKIEAKLLKLPVSAYKDNPERAATVAASAKELLDVATMEDVWTFSK